MTMAILLDDNTNIIRVFVRDIWNKNAYGIKNFILTIKLIFDL